MNSGGKVVVEIDLDDAKKGIFASVNQGATPPPQPPAPPILRYGSLGLLVFQNCAAVLLMRHTQTRHKGTSSSSGPQPAKYSVSSVVVVTELAKLLVCAAILLRSRGVKEALGDVYVVEGLAMAVPAFLYTLQNNLLFVALGNLEATLFQVTYQMKLIATAVLMVLLLGRRLTLFKWLSLLLLFIGIVLTQLNAKASAKSSKKPPGSLLTGLIAVTVCSLSSAFASVYFEKILKQTSPSLWVRNVQLALFSAGMAFSVYLFVENRSPLDFFVGYDSTILILVFNQALGGLLVASVMKYADNILKGFATAVAIIVSGVFSYLFLDFEPSMTFMVGAALVSIAVGLYSTY